jgi:hypothetical protein
MSTASWISVVTLTDVPSAELPAERLRSEGVTVEIRSDSAILGQARYCDLIVPSNLLHRANCLQSFGVHLIYMPKLTLGNAENYRVRSL